MAEKPCNLLKNGGGMTDYSTTEKVVGTWVDGKKLYEKTFTSIPPIGSTSTWVDIITLPTGATAKTVDMYMSAADGTIIPVTYATSTTSIAVWKANANIISLYTPQNTIATTYTTYAIVRYTKS